VVEYGDIDVDNQFMQLFLSRLNDYILESIEIFNSVTVEDIRAVAVRRYENSRLSAISIAPLNQQVLPLLRTAWNQESPYWNVVNATSGNQTQQLRTGSTAVAVAQIMAFHGYPVRPAGTIVCPVSRVSFIGFHEPQFGSTFFSHMAYNWGGMTAAQRAVNLPAVRQREIGVLMFEVSSHLQMTYVAGRSRARLESVPIAFRNMGYNEPLVFVPYNFNIIRSSIDARRPVYMRGTSTCNTVEHSWVVDGYLDIPFGQFVHANLGMGGTSSGWYRGGVFDTRFPHCTLRPPPVMCERDRPVTVLPPSIWEGGYIFRDNLHIVPNVHRR